MEPTAVGPFSERRVLFETGQEVDFALLPVAVAMGMAQAPEVMAVLRSGFRALVDTLGLEGGCGPAPPRRPGAARPIRRRSRS